MDINITKPAGVVLKTAQKYCSEDISVIPVLEDITVTPTTTEQVTTPTTGKAGISKVTIEAVTSTIDSNIVAENIKKDVSILGVTGVYDPQPVLQEQTVTITENKTTEIIPDSGKVLSKVSVTTNVQPTLQEKTIIPTTAQQTITADSGNDGLSEVTVKAVTAEIDNNIAAENIKKDVTILGVTGTLEQGGAEAVLGTLNVTSNGTYEASNALSLEPGGLYEYKKVLPKEVLAGLVNPSSNQAIFGIPTKEEFNVVGVIVKEQNGEYALMQVAGNSLISCYATADITITLDKNYNFKAGWNVMFTGDDNPTPYDSCQIRLPLDISDVPESFVNLLSKQFLTNDAIEMSIDTSNVVTIPDLGKFCKVTSFPINPATQNLVISSIMGYNEVSDFASAGSSGQQAIISCAQMRQAMSGSNLRTDIAGIKYLSAPYFSTMGMGLGSVFLIYVEDASKIQVSSGSVETGCWYIAGPDSIAPMFNGSTWTYEKEVLDGYNKVVVAIPTQEKTIEITTNGTTEITPDAKNMLSKVTVTTDVQLASQEKIIGITQNGVTEVIPDDGKVLSKVVIQTNVSDIDQKTGKYTVKVIDYDGVVLLETKGNTGDVIGLPASPIHDRLIFQEWSASVAVTNNSVTIEDSDIIVGAVYKTKSGKSEFDITLTKVTGLSVTLNMDGTKDWGDGTSDTATTHTYTAYGDYTIMCDGTTTNNYLFGQRDSTNYYCISARFANITSIATQAFCNCESLTTITIPNTVTSIGSSTFSSAYSLKHVILPSSITTVGMNAFYGCYSLMNIIIPNGITRIEDETFYYCYSLRNIILPNSITSIGTYAFQQCYSLTDINIPNGIKGINSHAFYYCNSLTEITIPSTVTAINVSAFHRCDSIVKYDFSQHTRVPTLSSTNAFQYINAICKIIVPDDLAAEWVAATNWSTYADYIYKVSEINGGGNDGNIVTDTNGNILQDSNGNNIEFTESVTLISFTIAGKSYQAEEGMTWQQWVNSSYNIDNFIVYNNYISTDRDAASGSRVTTDSAYNNAVSSTDIIAAAAYYFGVAN